MNHRTFNGLIDSRSEPHARTVLDDMCMEGGYCQTRLGLALQIAADTDDAAAADAAADAAATAAADAAADTDATDVHIRNLNRLFKEEPDMKNGLKVITLPGVYYGYGVTRVGWLKRVIGDENARTVLRTGNYTPEGISNLASDGPGKRYKLSEPDKGPEEVHRLLLRRCIPANERAWKEHCPKPKDWVEE